MKFDVILQKNLDFKMMNELVLVGGDNVNDKCNDSMKK